MLKNLKVKRSASVSALLLVMYVGFMFHEMTVCQVFCYKGNGSVDLESACPDLRCFCAGHTHDSHFENSCDETKFSENLLPECVDIPFNSALSQRTISISPTIGKGSILDHYPLTNPPDFVESPYFPGEISPLTHLKSIISPPIKMHIHASSVSLRC